MILYFRLRSRNTDMVVVILEHLFKVYWYLYWYFLLRSKDNDMVVAIMMLLTQCTYYYVCLVISLQSVHVLRYRSAPLLITLSSL